jgi:cobalamin biosynthesis protein CobW
VNWISRAPLSLPRFQQAISPLAARTLRIKGLLVFTEQPQQPLLFQCVGTRATLAPAPLPLPDGLTAQLVLIGRDGDIDAEEVDRVLQDIITPGAG